MKICFIGYKKLSEVAREVFAKNDITPDEILLVDANIDDLRSVVSSIVKRGYEIIIAGSANAAELKRYAGVTLIEIRLKQIDYVLAINKIIKTGKTIAVAKYKYDQNFNLSQVASLFDRNIELIEYLSATDLEQKMGRSEAEVFVGASLVGEIAEKLGKSSYFIYHGEETILDAVRRARAAAEILKRERLGSEIVNVAISESNIGVIGFSDKQEVIVCNEAACNILNLNQGQIKKSRLIHIVDDYEFSKFLKAEERSMAMKVRYADGALKVTLVKAESHGQIVGIVMMIETLDMDSSEPLSRTIATMSNLATFDDLIVNSAEMERVILKAKTFGKLGCPITLYGDYGTGKNAIAQSIYSFYGKGKGEYVCINCAAVLDSTAARFFYGRNEDHIDERKLVNLSMVGTLVLENIWDASERLQACLVWALQGKAECMSSDNNSNEMSFQTITIIPSDRVSAVEKNVRKDLFYMLGAMSINLPCLKCRKEDLFTIFKQFVSNDSQNFKKDIEVDDRLERTLLDYSWAGNLIELANVAKRYVSSLIGKKMTAVGRRRVLIESVGEEKLLNSIISDELAETKMEDISAEKLKSLIQRLKDSLNYSNDEIARAIGLSRSTIWRKLNQQ